MYYLWLNEEQKGPYSIEQLKSMYSSGSITADCLYFQEGMTDWMQITTLEAFKPEPTYEDIKQKIKPGDMICKSCGALGKPSTKARGSTAIELVAWICFLLPGIIYSVWRLTTKGSACKICGSTDLIPANSPMAENYLAKAQRTEEIPKKPMSTAKLIGLIILAILVFLFFLPTILMFFI